jgi:predicted enzyme related to lactoylglutathione lyase
MTRRVKRPTHKTMHTKSLARSAQFLVGASLAAMAAQAAPFPPITSPASQEHRPGKLIWADLFTSRPDAAASFYCNLLGWTSQTIDQKGRSYIILSNAGSPIAGITTRHKQPDNKPSRWIGYLSVYDLTATLQLVDKSGGRIHAKAREFPSRGFQAIIGDNEGNAIGLLQSTSGDPIDDVTPPGGWNWFELYVSNPQDSANFYHAVLGYDVAPETHSDRKSEFILASEGVNRAGIAPLPANAAGASPSWLGVIRVADLDAALAKTTQLGGSVLLPPRAAEYGSRFAIISDPTGGELGLVQYLDSESNPAKSP